MHLQKNTIKMICTTAQKMKSGLALKSFVHQSVERKEKAARHEHGCKPPLREETKKGRSKSISLKH